MNRFALKYGCNPNQTPAELFMEDGGPLPFEVINGRPGYINFLDALNGWQLVQELARATCLPAAASFKHVSPTAAAVGLPLPPDLARACFVDDIADLNQSPTACAYARARGADRMSSFGDWIALSHPCDETTAQVIKREVSDGIIAPGFSPAALKILSAKRNGNYAIIAIDPDYRPAAVERRQVFGVTLAQGRNDITIDESLLDRVVTVNKDIPPEARRDLIVALITLKYTQSNSVCFAAHGQTIGVGAGQQSRIHCTRLAGQKADLWHLRQHPQVLALPFLQTVGRAQRDNAIDQYLSEEDAEQVIGADVWQRHFSARPAPLRRGDKQAWLAAVRHVALGSDGFFPFGDNIDRAHRSGVRYIAQPGGSVRDADVIAACDRYAMTMALTGARLFHHG